MPAERVILDCDPGQDDAVAILLALASPVEIDLLAITTVAGNVPLDLTSKNARRICELTGHAGLCGLHPADGPHAHNRGTCPRTHGS